MQTESYVVLRPFMVEELDAIEAKRRESAEESAAEFRKAVAKREKARRDDEYAKAHGMP